jgi:hypothetical protein
VSPGREEEKGLSSTNARSEAQNAHAENGMNINALAIRAA